MKTRKTMKQIVAESRDFCARLSWRKAAVIGNLRHVAASAGDHGVARLCAAAKDKFMLRAIELAGHRIQIQEATDDPRFYSVRFRGERIRALHMPKDRLLLGGELALARIEDIGHKEPA